ncbi:endothelin-converting enzyme 1 [Platysternon megacephalum]|uniref:Endothelin-converting enzyme 1 n=1 Tax=Platysternon megacephalum TaxID=55544 RepID=A0A4D9DRJ1_9SAUR|nr:endothelin-converting enzyme 1 [Platysternon megacephalum]
MGVGHSAGVGDGPQGGSVLVTLRPLLAPPVWFCCVRPLCVFPPQVPAPVTEGAEELRPGPRPGLKEPVLPQVGVQVAAPKADWSWDHLQHSVNEPTCSTQAGGLVTPHERGKG